MLRLLLLLLIHLWVGKVREKVRIVVLGLLRLLGHHSGLLGLLGGVVVEFEKVAHDLLLLLGRHGLELVLYRQLTEFKPSIILRWRSTTPLWLMLLLLLSVAPIQTRNEWILSNFL